MPAAMTKRSIGPSQREAPQSDQLQERDRAERAVRRILGGDDADEVVLQRERVDRLQATGVLFQGQRAAVADPPDLERSRAGLHA